jgi:hypothetical protein
MSEVETTMDVDVNSGKLFNEGYLSSFNTTQYQITMNARQESEELAQSKGTSVGVYRVHKDKFGGKKTVLGKKHNDISNHVSAIRKKWITRTLSIGSSGMRFIPSDPMRDLKIMLEEGKTEFYRLIDEFIDMYKDELSNGNLQSIMGSQFNRNNYPDLSILPEVVKSKYAWHMPLLKATSELGIKDTTLGDYKQQIADATQVENDNYYGEIFNQAKQKLQKGFMEYINHTLSSLDLVKQYRDVSGKFYYGDDGIQQVAKKPSISQGLIDNAKTLSMQLNTLNIWGDKVLEDARVRIVSLLKLVGDDRKQLADSPILQQEMANAVSKIQSDFASKFDI